LVWSYTFNPNNSSDVIVGVVFYGVLMALQTISKRAFMQKKEAIDWAKDQKKKYGPASGVKWETNRLTNAEPMKWEARIYKEV
tara:strand:- start:550 stop:798 length:249 start_codon:yes stop_codon:yes gene_type:complete